MTAAKSRSTKRAMRLSALQAELDYLAGDDSALAYLLQHAAQPTAEDYINLQWWGDPPEEFEGKYAEAIDTLKRLEAERSR